MNRSSKWWLGASLCSVGLASHAQEAVFSDPRVQSYLGAPLIVELDVAPPAGGALSIPCVKVLKTTVPQGSAARDSVSNGRVAISRSDVRGVVQIHSIDIVRSSPVLLSLDIGCAKPMRVDYVLNVVAPPDVPVASTPAPMVVARAQRRKAVTQAKGAAGSETSAAVVNRLDPQVVLDRVRDMPRLSSSSMTY